MKQTPSVGRVVHYQSYGTPGGEYLPEPRAAIITATDGGGDAMARALKICALRGCPRVTSGRYCPGHQAAHDKQRGTKAERGYDSKFYAIRREYVERHETEPFDCIRCGEPIPINEPFHLDHDDDDRSIIRGPSHPLCNLSAAGKASHRFD